MQNSQWKRHSHYDSVRAQLLKAHKASTNATLTEAERAKALRAKRSLQRQLHKL